MTQQGRSLRHLADL